MTQEEIKYHNQLWYYKTYNQLIDKCIQMESEGYPDDMYTEIHHILPKCMGGTNDKSNLVRMPVRYHIMAHMLLASAYRYSKSIFAVNAMFIGTEKEFKERSAAVNKISVRLISKFREDYKLSLRKSGIELNNGDLVFKSKTVVCFTKSYDVIKIYTPINTVKHDGINPSTVQKHCKSKTEYAGYFWDYLDNFEKNYSDKLNNYYVNLKLGTVPKMDKTYSNLSITEKLKRRKSIPRTEEWKKKISLSNKGKSKTILSNNTTSNKGRSKKVIDLTGEIYDTVKSAAYKYNISEKTLRKWINNNPEKGFKFVEDSRILDPNDNCFDTLQECADYYKVSKTMISKWIKDSNKNFRYINKS